MNASTIDVIIGVVIAFLLNNAGTITLFVKEQIFYTKLNFLTLMWVPGQPMEKLKKLQKARATHRKLTEDKISYQMLPRDLKAVAEKITRIVSIFSALHVYNKATNKGKICFFFMFPSEIEVKTKIINLLGQAVEKELREWNLEEMEDDLFCLTTMSSSEIPDKAIEAARKNFKLTSQRCPPWPC